MTDHENNALDALEKHRKAIDRLDAIWLYALAERFAHTNDVGKLKAKYKLESYDPKRERAQKERLRQMAINAGLDPDFAEKMLDVISHDVIKHHNEIKENTKEQ